MASSRGRPSDIGAGLQHSPRRRRSKVALRDLLSEVPGWLTENEAWALHEAARTCRADLPAITAVELGSWHGRSTIALASGLRARGGGVVAAVDPHRATALHRATGIVDSYAAFQANVRRAGVADHVRAIRATSMQARERFADGAVDLLFIDASHAYEDVLADIETWSGALAHAAVVGFHDIHDEPGVVRALAERVTLPDSPFHDLREVDNLLLAEFRRARALA